MRDIYQPDSTPSSLFEPTTSAGQERVGGDWGRVMQIPGGPYESGNTLGGDPGVFRPTMVGRPNVSSWTTSAGALNVASDTTPADEPGVVSNTAFRRGQDGLSTATRRIRVGERFEASGATTTSATASGLHGRALPQETPGGGTASSDAGTGAPSTGGGVEATLRRSARGWKPSTECLTIGTE